MFETVQFVTVEQKAGGNTNVSVGKQKTIFPEFQNKATPKNYSSRWRRNLLVKNPRMRTRYSALSTKSLKEVKETGSLKCHISMTVLVLVSCIRCPILKSNNASHFPQIPK